MKIILLLLSLFLITACQSSDKHSTVPGGLFDSQPPRKQKETLGFVPRGLNLSKAPEKIVFGCCGDQEKDQPIWEAILDEKAHLMIATGDNLKTDTVEKRTIAEQYKKMIENEDYVKARETVPFLITWDDMDYGMTNGGSSNPQKEEARRAMMFYYPYIKDSTLLDQPGIFHSKVLGGIREGRGRRARTTPSVHVIMLDTRWNRTERSLLGSDQWDWLEDQLREPADFKILVSSIQVLPEGHAFDKWSQYPKEKEKLLNMIAKIKPKNFLILSGDRKLGAISKMDLKNFGTLYEVTAGNFNQPQELLEKDPIYMNEAYNKENFGLITINWTKRVAGIEIKNIDGKPVQTLEMKLKK